MSQAEIGSRPLEGRRAIVTGAASGIGKGIAESFLAAGASVLAIDRPSADWINDDRIEDNLARLAIDLTDDDAPGRIVETAARLLGGIDILVNNAGITVLGAAEAVTDAEWNRILAVNVTAVLRLTREAAAMLKASGNGRIIDTGSIMSELAGPGQIAYITSKHAIAGMTKAMAVDLGPYGVRANFIQPGAIVTPLSEPFMADEQFMAYWQRKIPLGRLGRPADIGPVAVFLASSAADYVSGEGLRIDGAATCNM